MSYLSKEKQETFLDFLKNEYNTTYKEVTFGGLIPVFFVVCKNETELKRVWNTVTSLIATNFQINLEEEYPTWNIYIFFLIEETVSNSIRYEIENDTFSSRKIIVIGKQSEEDIIQSHIINELSEIADGASKREEIDFECDTVIENVLKDKKIIGKKQVTDESRTSLEELINNLKTKSSEV